MQQIQKTIDDLTEIVNKINEVSIIEIDQKSFAKILAHVHGIINHYYRQRESKARSINVINLGHQILNTVLSYHISNKLSATKNAVHIFEKTAELLLTIIATDFGLTKSKYQEALAIRKNLRAIKVCGINLHSHIPPSLTRWHDSDSEHALDEEALKFASENIKQFTRFVFDVVKNDLSIQDPFTNFPYSEALSIYSRIESLIPSAIPLTHDQTSTDA